MNLENREDLFFKAVPALIVAFGVGKWVLMPLAKHVFEQMLEQSKPKLKEIVDKLYEVDIKERKMAIEGMKLVGQQQEDQKDFNAQMFSRVEGTMEKLTETMSNMGDQFGLMREEMSYWRGKFDSDPSNQKRRRIDATEKA